MADSPAAFLQSFTIITREGLEVVLLLGAMLAVLGRLEAPDQARGLWVGAGLAVLASIATAFALRSIARSTSRVEALEGFTMLVAAGVLIWVGHWLLARADVARWRAYLERRLRGAVGKRSLLALAAVAFVAVYREGVETVLFYAALLAGESARPAAVLAGFLAGLAVLALCIRAIQRFGARIPLRPFFAATGALLLLLAFTFGGKGVHELQEAGLLGESWLSPFVQIPALGIHPTVEGLLVQSALLLAIAAPVLYRWGRRAHQQPGRAERRGGAASRAG